MEKNTIEPKYKKELFLHGLNFSIDPKSKEMSFQTDIIDTQYKGSPIKTEHVSKLICLKHRLQRYSIKPKRRKCCTINSLINSNVYSFLKSVIKKSNQLTI